MNDSNNLDKFTHFKNCRKKCRKSIIKEMMQTLRKEIAKENVVKAKSCEFFT